MKFLCYHFAQHHEIDQAIYLLGMNSDFSELAALLDTAAIKDLRLVYEDACNHDALMNYLNQEQKKRFKILDKEEFRANLREYCAFAFIVDCYANISELMLFANANPKALVGYFNRGFNSFRLWESYREHTDTIVIARYVNPLRNEVLDWNGKDYEKELSIIFPVYNVGAYIAQCVESVTAWKAPYVEFLFVSDGSKDDSVKILREYAAKDSRIQILEKENGGCASARQYGLERAKGRYIGFVDPDDYVDETMFQKLLSRALTGTYEISYSGYKEYYEDTGESQPIDDLIGLPYEAGTTDEELIDDLIAYRRIAIWRGIYAASLIKRNNIAFHLDLPRFDDLPFKVETLAVAKSVVSVPEYLYYYRLGRKGQDVAADDERLYVHFDIFQHLDAFFTSTRSSKQKDLYRIVKVQTHAWALTRIKSYYKEDYREKAAKDIGIPNTKKAWIKAVGECGGEVAVRDYKTTLKNENSPLLNHDISVIIPCHNRLGTIEATLNALERAPLLRYEAILIDDGSREHIADELQTIARSHKHTRLLRLPHQGVSAARNAGLKAAKGDYVWFVDSDDEIPGKAFASIEEAFGGEDADVMCFDSLMRDGDLIVQIKSNNYGQGNLLNGYLQECADNPFLWNKLYRRLYLEENNIRFDENISLGEDALFNFIVFQKAKKARTIHRPLYLYHYHSEDSVMVRFSEKEKAIEAEHSKIASTILALIDPKEFDEEGKEALIKYLECLVVRGENEFELQQKRDTLMRQINDLSWR